MPQSRSTTVQREMQALRRSLLAMARTLQRLGPLLSRGDQKPRRKLTLSPARRESLRLQGLYMGHIRGLKPRAKAKVRRSRLPGVIRRRFALAKRLGRAA